MTLHIELDDYPSIETTVVFDVVIAACQLDGSAVTTTAVADQSYIVYTPQIDFTWIDFVISPCVYGLDYTYSLYNTVTTTTTAIPGPVMIT